ncbi:hypothetical protein MATL_G00075160 [Megalops atlanticus]|uniref:Uncharacterized protein n=1 Tax=Megalops atlanticus TaxID=7932 RepID=A0A9D3QAH9_MEGAT|nr:hypothetical protein MATL_G00075160 [Megalops atlanticus]
MRGVQIEETGAGKTEFRYPSYVQHIMGDVFSLGFSSFCLVCTLLIHMTWVRLMTLLLLCWRISTHQGRGHQQGLLDGFGRVRGSRWQGSAGLGIATPTTPSSR